ncbi:MAG: preprotein translocase subunit SecG [candidate division BRC1 bacterium ADurb.BinA364]|nr:MAG: preprotein translocase subunit SecG [candidate division BRC1 bacterium ADurb.BinA364]
MNRWTTYCAIGFGVLAIAMTLIGRIGANPSSIYDEIGGDDSSLLAPAPDAEEQGAVSPDVDAPTPSLDVELPAEPGQAPSAAEAPEMPPDGGLSAAPAADKTPAAASDAP